MEDQNTRKIFSEVITSTQCPFAKKGQIHYGTTWSDQIEFTDQIKIWAQEMTRFIELVPTTNPDGFVIGAHGTQAPKTLQELSLFVCRTLNELTIHSRGHSLDQHEVSADGWQFSFHEIRMFLVVMSSIYSKTNSRHSPVPNSTFMFFQPEASFDNFMPHSEHDPRTQRLKESIRRDFVRAHMKYDTTIVASTSEVSKYVKPHDLGDPIVKWWVNL